MEYIPDIFSITDLRVIICSYLDIKSITSLHLYLKKELHHDILKDIYDNTKWYLYECKLKECNNLSDSTCYNCYNNHCHNHLNKCEKCDKITCVKCTRKCKCHRFLICSPCVNNFTCNRCLEIYCRSYTKLCIKCKLKCCNNCLSLIGICKNCIRDL